MPSLRASDTAGAICNASSSPSKPPSLACGLSAATPMRGAANPHCLKHSSVSRSLASTLARVTWSQARRSERCVVRCTTRSEPAISMVATFLAPVWLWNISMWPTSEKPARLHASLLMGAVAMARTLPAAASSPALRIHSTAALPASGES